MKFFHRVSLLFLAALHLYACSDSSDRPPTAPPEPLAERYVLSSEDSIPEGIAFDSLERAFYATSLNGGSITRIAADGEESLFREPDDRARLIGAKVDARARRLWVCAQGVDGLDNRVWLFDLDSGELSTEFLLGALVTGGSCNDVILDEDGRAYVTDPANPYLYLLDAATERGEILVTDPLLEDEAGVSLGQNGIEITADGSALIVAKFAARRLIRVSLPNGDQVSEVALEGDFFPAPDGLVFLDGDLYSVSNAEVARIRFSDDYTRGDVVVVPQISGLSTATVAEGDIYVIKSEVTNNFLGRPLELPFEFFRLDTSAYGD